MLKRTSQLKNQLEQMIDAVIAAISFTLAIVVRRILHVWNPDVFPLFDALWNHAWLYMLMVPLWVFLLDFSGLYQHRLSRATSSIFGMVLRTNAAGVIVTFFILYVLKIPYIPRVLILLFAVIDIALMMCKELFIRNFEPMWTRTMNVLLIGEPGDLASVVQSLKALPAWQFRILGSLSPKSAGSAAPMDGVPFLGAVDQLESVMHRESIDYVIISPGREHFDRIQNIVAICETEGVEAWMVAAFVRTNIARAHVDEFQDIPMLVFSSTPAVSWALLLKRVMDVAGSLALVVLLSPLMFLVALLIRLDSRGPVLFKQRRCTLHGKAFSMYKFRTMITEAENLRAELEGRNEMGGPVFKIKDDPRVTRIGRFLRRHSLDELPQLFNVLNGDMSLVGPRPPIPDEVKRYENWQRRRLSMRAGITCLWQVSGRNHLSFEDWMRLDLRYIDNWSLMLDLQILLKTPLAMFRGTGY